MACQLPEIGSFKGNNLLSRDKLNYAAGSLKNIHYGDIHTKFSTSEKNAAPTSSHLMSVEVFKAEKFCIEGDIIFADASEDLTIPARCPVVGPR